MPYPRVILKSNKEASVKRFHPWIFSGAIDMVEDSIKDGDSVCVQNSQHEFLAYGTYQEGGSISVRILSFEENQEPNEAFINQKLIAAFTLRQTLGLLKPDNNICRLIHAEGDGLPGLIIDFYNHHLVIQPNSLFAERYIFLIKEALLNFFGGDIKSIYVKAGQQATNGYFLFGDQESCIAYELDIAYHVDWVHGQKTGFFIDQRDNRALLRQYANGKKVLNTFSYSGGFSLAALYGGAKEAVSLDSSQHALDLAKNNAALNAHKYKGTHRCIKADAVQYMHSAEASGYDLVVLDPPAFAKHRNAKHNAVQAYKRLNAAAFSGIKSGGFLFTFSCSQVVDKILFQNTVNSAAIEAGREVKLLHRLQQPVCHPVSIYHTEGEYLKGLVLQVL